MRGVRLQRFLPKTRSPPGFLLSLHSLVSSSYSPKISSLSIFHAKNVESARCIKSIWSRTLSSPDAASAICQKQKNNSLFKSLKTRVNSSKMVVKTNATLATMSQSQKVARRLVKKYRKGGSSRSRLAKAESYWRLKKLLPSISRKDNISKLDVVLEAISYIQRLQDDLELAILKGSVRNC